MLQVGLAKSQQQQQQYSLHNRHEDNNIIIHARAQGVAAATPARGEPDLRKRLTSTTTTTAKRKKKRKKKKSESECEKERALDYNLETRHTSVYTHTHRAWCARHAGSLAEG